MTEYKKKIVWLQNDFGFEIPFRCADEEGTPIDISGCTIRIRIAEKDATVAKVVGTCNITDGPNGLCKYIVQDGDFDVADKTYLTQLVATKTGFERKFRGLTIQVVAELPDSES